MLEGASALDCVSNQVFVDVGVGSAVHLSKNANPRVSKCSTSASCLFGRHFTLFVHEVQKKDP